MGEGEGEGDYLMERKLTPLAKNLRKMSTDTEKVVWKQLRAKRFSGLKFRRQQPLGPYIADFVCFEKKIIIELDGGQHAFPGKIQGDLKRDKWFEAQGYTTLRFWDNEVLTNTQGVIEVIWKHCFEPPSPQSPPIEGGEVS